MGGLLLASSSSLLSFLNCGKMAKDKGFFAFILGAKALAFLKNIWGGGHLENKMAAMWQFSLGTRGSLLILGQIEKTT